MLISALIYARYSSDRQRPTSIDDQVALCRGAAPQFDCEVVEQLVLADYEISGSSDRRPAYQRLLAAVRAHEVNAILVESQDRLWRDQAEMHAALRLFRFHGVKVFSVATGGDLTNPSGRVLATVMGLKDELYLDDLRAKTHRGLTGQVQRGFNDGGRSYGYQTQPVTDPTVYDSHGQPRVLGPARC